MDCIVEPYEVSDIQAFYLQKIAVLCVTLINNPVRPYQVGFSGTEPKSVKRSLFSPPTLFFILFYFILFHVAFIFF